MEGFKLQTKETKFNDIYIALHTPSSWQGKTILYVHGGPGSHAKDFEYGLYNFKEFREAEYAYVTYDQRGSGRSEISNQNLNQLSHKKNIEDLLNLIINAPKIFNLEKIDLIYGHSYGAKLVYDTLWKHQDVNLKYLLAGISLYPSDAFNTSLFLDLFLLKSNQPQEFKEALKIIANQNKEPYLYSPQIRQLFHSLEKRQLDRQKFYWANEAALNWWNSVNERSNVKDNNQAYFKIVETFCDETFNSGSYDPSQLSQTGTYIIGFHDILMNGSTTFSSKENNIIKFMASSHYPHFEEPELFIQTIRNIFNNEKNSSYNFIDAC